MTASLFELLQTSYSNYKALVSRPKVRRIGWVVAGLIFGIAGYLSYQSLPAEFELKPLALFVAAMTVPLVVIMTAAEVYLLGRLCDVRFLWRESLSLTLNGALANLAPVPGSVAVRLGGIHSRGGSLKQGASATFVIGLMWVGVSLFLGGLAVATESHGLWSWVFVTSGLMAGIAAFLLAASRHNRGAALASWVLVVELLIVVTSSIRTALVMAALGYEADLGQALVITMSQVIATAVGFFPAGLGLSELLAGVTAPLTGLAPSIAIAVAIVDRLVRLSVLAVLSLTSRVWLPIAVTGRE